MDTGHDLKFYIRDNLFLNLFYGRIDFLFCFIKSERYKDFKILWLNWLQKSSNK